jgi:hypothetical protein
VVSNTLSTHTRAREIPKTMKLDSVAKGVADSLDFWLQQHEVSFPELLKRTTADVFNKWLDSTEIIEAIAKNTSDLPQCLKINPNL